MTLFVRQCFLRTGGCAMLLLLMSLLRSNCLLAQQSDGIDKMVSSSPQVSTFMKMGEFPVSYYTGTPEISIPLFTLSDHDLQIPLVLSNDGSALQVADLPSWVGQSWTLLPGGCITKVIIGSDQDYGDTTNYKIMLKGKDYSRSVLLGGDTGRYNAQFLSWSQNDPWHNLVLKDRVVLDLGLPDLIEKGQYYQPDIYNFNFLEHRGKFYINPGTKQLVFLQNPDNVVMLYSGNINDGWIATMPDGTKVYFTVLETKRPILYGSYNVNYTWKISKIVQLNGETYTFSYKEVNYNLYEQSDLGTFNYQTNQDDATTIELMGNNPTSAQYPLNMAYGSNLFYNQCYEKFLTKIDGPGYTINFNLTDEPKPKLASIIYYNNQNTDVVKKFTFEYAEYKRAEGNFESTLAGSPFYSGASIYSKFKLTKLTGSTIIGGVEQKDQPYTFEYIENIGLPTIMSRARDYWGFYNGQDNSILFPDESKIFSTTTFTEQSRLSADALLTLRAKSNARRWVDTAYTQQGMLRKITYPTKGSTVFNYEPHVFSYPGAHILTAYEYVNFYRGGNDSVSVGAGMRIKEMIKYDQDGRFVGRKKMVYGGPGSQTSATLFIPLNFWKIRPLAKATPGIAVYHDWNGSITNLNSTPLIPYLIGYTNVDVYDCSQEQDGPDNKTNGRTNYIFHNTPLGFNMPFNYPYLTLLDYRNGLTDRIEFYDDQGRLKKREDYHYTQVMRNEYTAIKGYMLFENAGTIVSAGYNTYAITYYPLIGETWKTDSITQKIYDTDNNVYIMQTSMSYTTDTTHQLYQQNVKRSEDDGLTSTYYTYPYNYTDTDGFIKDMLNNNIVDKPIETVVAITNGNNVRIKSGTITTYGRGMLSNKPAQTYRMEISTLQPLSGFRFSNKATTGFLPANDVNSTFYLNTALYKKNTAYSGYDSYGNLTQFGKDGDINSTFIWDYNSMMPIATLQEATANAAAFTSFEADGSGGWMIPDTTRNSTVSLTGTRAYDLKTSITKASLPAGEYVVSYWLYNGSVTVNGSAGNSKGSCNNWTYYEHMLTGSVTSITVSGVATIDELRLYPKGARMNSYTYNPLLGRTTECNPAGLPLFYLYDSLGRLAAVKDSKGNIVKTYEYHTRE